MLFATWTCLFSKPIPPRSTTVSIRQYDPRLEAPPTRFLFFCKNLRHFLTCASHSLWSCLLKRLISLLWHSVLFLHFVSVSMHLRSTYINTQCVITSVIMLTVIIDSFFTISTIPKRPDQLWSQSPSYSSGAGSSYTRGKATKTCSRSPIFIYSAPRELLKPNKPAPLQYQSRATGVGSLRNAVRLWTSAIALMS